MFGHSSYENVLYHLLVTVLSISYAMTTSLTCMENSIGEKNTGDQHIPVREWPNEMQWADPAPYLLSLQTPFM